MILGFVDMRGPAGLWGLWGRLTAAEDVSYNAPMRRKLAARKNAGEVRVRLSKLDLERLEWLIEHHPDDHTTTASALVRALIAQEYARFNDSLPVLSFDVPSKYPHSKGK